MDKEKLIDEILSRIKDNIYGKHHFYWTNARKGLKRMKKRELESFYLLCRHARSYNTEMNV